MIAPVRVFERHLVPLDRRPAKQLIEAGRRHFRHHVTALAKSVERFHKSVDVAMPLQEAPVEPADIRSWQYALLFPPGFGAPRRP